MLLKPICWWSSPLHLLHFCPSWERDPSHVALSEVTTLRDLLRVKGIGCHTLLKPYETNCDLWIWAIQTKYDWWLNKIFDTNLSDHYCLFFDVISILCMKGAVLNTFIMMIIIIIIIIIIIMMMMIIIIIIPIRTGPPKKCLKHYQSQIPFPLVSCEVSAKTLTKPISHDPGARPKRNIRPLTIRGFSNSQSRRHSHSPMAQRVVTARGLLTPSQPLGYRQDFNLVGIPGAAMPLIWVISKPAFMRKKGRGRGKGAWWSMLMNYELDELLMRKQELPSTCNGVAWALATVTKLNSSKALL